MYFHLLILFITKSSVFMKSVVYIDMKQINETYFSGNSIKFEVGYYYMICTWLGIIEKKQQ